MAVQLRPTRTIPREFGYGNKTVRHAGGAAPSVIQLLDVCEQKSKPNWTRVKVGRADNFGQSLGKMIEKEDQSSATRQQMAPQVKTGNDPQEKCIPRHLVSTGDSIIKKKRTSMSTKKEASEDVCTVRRKTAAGEKSRLCLGRKGTTPARTSSS